MTKQNWTPGPWQLGEKTVFKDHGFKIHGYPISAGGQAIARVHAGSVGKEAFSFGNQEANARLIACAPEMAEALQVCRAQFLKYERMHYGKGTPDGNKKAEINAKFVEMCDALLAKLESAA